MSANSDWIKAYEAQKAKALERLTAAKSGNSTDTNVSGLSGSTPAKNKINRPRNSLYGAPQNSNRPSMGVPPGRTPSFGANHNQQNRHQAPPFRGPSWPQAPTFGAPPRPQAPPFGAPQKPQSLMDMSLSKPGKPPSNGANGSHNQSRPQNTGPPKPLMSLSSAKASPPTASTQRYIN